MACQSQYIIQGIYPQMKNPLQGVIVEYKGGRRARSGNKPNALWGNIDLKAIAREVEEDPTTPGEKVVSEITVSETAPVTLTAELPPAEPVPASVEAPPITIAEDTAKPATVDTLPAMPSSNPAARYASEPKQRAVRTRRAKKPRVEQPIDLPAIPLSVAVPTGDEIEALQAENTALKHQLIEKLRHENNQLTKMLARVNQAAIR
ncbi:hypothetical protein DKP76_16495 [Falsochrobactrum shanghaiense]|uniref:Uncharacterized protein n=1 Tax=Falsochrobactrum shanghaiense TaxID=2201899 RepID=A0A316JC41_9HYPH|nr:hypothetical protein [Falsochrobactrum shanghaiense]PWL16573.1 hypothetical protein DKP76_16495 [Falsochrobactrum shanghaiense]